MTDEIEYIDAAFRDLTVPISKLTRLSSGHMWTEGPVWMPAHQCLYFSDIPNQHIHRWTADGQVSSFRSPSNFTNGNTFDGQGRLISCQHGTRSVTRTEHNGSISKLADSYEGKRLNSPNDVVVKRDGTIWFSDPTYGILSNYEGYAAQPEQDYRNVFCLEPSSKTLKSVTNEFTQPNGLAFSPDEKTLYVAESGKSHDETVPAIVWAYPVNADNSLGTRHEFARIEPGLPDGLRVDREGNVWISSAMGVQCFDASGNILGKIHVPEMVSNLEFGGPRNTMLFITGHTSLYAIHVATTDARR